MGNTRTHRRRSRREVDGILKRFDRSGLAQKAFAASQDLSLSTLHYWLNRRRREGSSSVASTNFVALKIPSVAEPGRSAGLELELRGDLRLHIPADIDREALATLLPTIIAAC